MLLLLLLFLPSFDFFPFTLNFLGVVLTDLENFRLPYLSFFTTGVSAMIYYFSGEIKLNDNEVSITSSLFKYFVISCLVVMSFTL